MGSSHRGSQQNLLAVPKDEGASFILVMRLHNKTFNSIDSGRCKGDPCKFGLAALDERVYVGPGISDEILVIDAASEKKIASIGVKGFSNPRWWRWTHAIAVGRKIFFAPGRAGCILALDVDTEEQQCFKVPKDGTWSYFGIYSFGSALYLDPVEERTPLRVDLADHPTCAV